MSINKRIVIYVKIVLPLVLIVLFFAMPSIVTDKPRIESIEPAVIMANCNFNDDNSLTLRGKEFQNIIAFYIDGKWEKDVSIISEGEEEVRIKLPSKYYNEGAVLSIAFEKKINTDMTVKSNAVKFKVLSDDIIPIPTITKANPAQLIFDGNLEYMIQLKGDNINEDSVIYINNKAVETKYVDDYCEAKLPYSLWCNKKDILIRVKQKYNGVETSVKSKAFYISTNSKNVSQGDAVENEQIMLNYLSSLDKKNYIVIFAVKDESTQAVTERIIRYMQKLGLNENITIHGVHQSYIGILDGGNNIYEEISDELLCYDYESDGTKIYVESANFNVGNNSRIVVNDVDYSVNETGLNIVVFDKNTKTVVDSVCFNTFSGLDLTVR